MIKTMMIPKGVWLALAAVGCSASGVGVFAGYHQPPKWENPVRMTHEVIYSARDFVQVTGQLVPIFSQVNTRLAVMQGLGNHFVSLTDNVGLLPALAVGTGTGAGALATQLAPVPALIKSVGDQVTQGSGEVSTVTGTVNSVTAQLEQVETSLGGLSSQLASLAPTAAGIASTLAEIATDTHILGQLGAGNLLAEVTKLLSLLGVGAQG